LSKQHDTHDVWVSSAPKVASASQRVG
jgi:hypothetical protein